jgi:hypothetical protein
MSLFAMRPSWSRVVDFPATPAGIFPSGTSRFERSVANLLVQQGITHWLTSCTAGTWRQE